MIFVHNDQTRMFMNLLEIIDLSVLAYYLLNCQHAQLIGKLYNTMKTICKTLKHLCHIFKKHFITQTNSM